MTSRPVEPAAPALSDPEQETALRRDGYVVVPLLSPDTVAELREAYTRIVPPGDHGLTVDYMRPDRSVMRALRDLLDPVWTRALATTFVGYRPVMTTFVAKAPGPESGMFLHEDRSYVDEDRARAYTVWVPLDDVGPDRANGGLEVVPGSHRLATRLGGSHTPDLFRPYERFLRSRLVPVTATAGDAVVYDTRALHASGPNLTDAPRLALVCAVAPVDEDLLHVVATSRTRRRVHRVTPEFFVEHHPRDIERAMPADCPVVAEYDEEPELTPDQVAAALGSERPTADPVVSERCRRPDDPETFTELPWRNEPADAGGRPSPSAAAVTALEGDVAHEGATVTMAPGALATLSADPARGLDLVVRHAPAVASGLRGADRAVTFEPGRRITVPTGETFTVWNDGPGSLVLDLRRPPRLWRWSRRR